MSKAQDATTEAMNAAQAAHAAALTWKVDRFVSSVSDAELTRLHLAALHAEQAYYLAFGEAAEAEQVGYQIEIAERDARAMGTR